MRILYVTTVGGTMPFFKDFIRELLDMGHTVDIAASIKKSPVPQCYNEWKCKTYHISCSRKPFDKGNLTAIGELKKIISEGKYDIIHCHTPIAAACTRIACRKMRKKGVTVFYTAHGFHFFKGAPVKNWLIYFPVEWLCSFFTDDLITINREDFAFAKKHLHAKNTYYVPGVGVNVDRFKKAEVDREKKREELGIPKDSIAILSVGELNDNKNHETVLRAIAALNRKDVVYIICGKGSRKDYLESLAKELGIEKQLLLAGFRTDVHEIYKCCNIFALPSKREGLPVSVMEAMASGLPCVVSDIRGNRDLIVGDKGGFVCDFSSVTAFSEKIKRLIEDKTLCEKMGAFNLIRVKEFEIEEVKKQMSKIYNV